MNISKAIKELNECKIHVGDVPMYILINDENFELAEIDGINVEGDHIELTIKREVVNI